jgi:PAS domain S-box-containing protein
VNHTEHAVAARHDWAWFFSSENFMPHGHCFLWNPTLLWLNVIADGLIAAAYLSVPFTIVFFLWHKRNLRWYGVYVAFAAFILFCGLGHALDVVTLWNPIYGVSTTVKLLTAVASVVTAIGLWPIMPKILTLPSWFDLEVKNAELAKANEKYDLLFEESAVGFFEWRDVTDPQAIYWSRRLYRIFGLKKGEFRPTVDSFLDLIHPEDRDRMKMVLKPDIENGEFRPIEYRLKIGDEYRWYRSHRRVKYDDTGKPLFVVGSVEDIHENKIAEEKLVHMNQTLDREVKRRTQQLEAANEAKSRFLAHMSHEIRTPLGLILGFSELLADDSKLNPHAHDYVQLIIKNGEILSRVVNDLLDLSKVEAGKLRFSHAKTKLHGLVEEVRAAFEEKASQKGLQFEFSNSVPPDLTLITDEIRLKQIMYNLLSNSIKFTEKGKIQIACGILKDDPKYFYFDVIDTGLGVTPEDRDRIFLEFVQGTSTQSVRDFGSGLGLRLSRSLAQALGGQVTLISSEVNSGSHFRLTFSSQDNRSYGYMQPSNGNGTHQSLKDLRVSVLDDNDDNVRLAELFLRKLGCSVHGFTEPEVFLQQTLKQPPDLVLLDINMPQMNGFEVFDYLRKHGFGQPIWALTAHALNDDIQQILNRGFDAYILKPINLATMRQKLITEFSEVKYG